MAMFSVMMKGSEKEVFIYATNYCLYDNRLQFMDNNGTLLVEFQKNVFQWVSRVAQVNLEADRGGDDSE